MRNVILAVVAIAALTAAGVGGVFADFSDIETSEDNFFQTGSLDLKVSDYMGTEYQDPDVPAFFELTDAWPCCDKSVFFDLENWGQGFQKVPWVYLHIKNLSCYWVVPKNVWKWVDETGAEVAAPIPEPPHHAIGTGFPKPLNEPEYVAECGGVAGELADGTPVVVPGIGVCYGENCELSRHVGIIGIYVAGPYPEELKPETSADVPAADWVLLDLSEYDVDPADGIIKLNELVCEEIELGNLPNNQGIWVHISLHFQNFDEEDAFAEGLIPTTYFAEDYPEKKWDHWPTNALQKDGVTFDIAFELLQNQVP